MKRPSILIVAFHYPPFHAGSGVLRTLAFSRNLVELGWDVSVLTSLPFNRRGTANGAADLVPENCNVIRTLSFDAAENLSILGKYPSFLDVPDRFSSWIVSAALRGLLQIKKRPVDFIFSTYPVASAHVIGRILSKYSKIKWIADFRDPMIMEGHPDTAARRQSHLSVERKTIENCSGAIFTTETASEQYRQNYPAIPESRFKVIENGYDDEIFGRAEPSASRVDEKDVEKDYLVLLHSGSLYPNHRDPEPFFAALHRLTVERSLGGLNLRVVLRDCGYANQFQMMIQSKYPSLTEQVIFKTHINYVEAVSEMLTCDGLLLFQGATCNAQIPGKIYEYARSYKPILAIGDMAGETLKFTRKIGITEHANITSPNEIESLVQRFLLAHRNNQYKGFIPTIDTTRLSRMERTKELDRYLRENL